MADAVLSEALPSARLDDEQLFAEAALYERAAKAEGKAKKEKAEAGERIVFELKAREVTVVENAATSITLVQTVTVDEDVLYRACTPRQRAELFGEELDLNALEDDVRALLADLLTPEQRAAIARRVLRKELLAEPRYARSAALRRAKVPGKAYPRISHGGPKRRTRTRA